ncbi:MAG: hemerythrin family protein [Rhodocyclaceae bacterium]|nr:hemerythrin family protein [Rhodocyclaceae bacterium]
MPSHTHPQKMVWHARLTIGIPAIDEQHARLCGLANRLLDHPDAPAHDERVVDILTDLGQFLILHLQTEEEYMRRLGMPTDEIANHHQAHNRIIDQYADLNLAATQGRMHTAAEIFRLVRRWVSDHLDMDDLKIRDYMTSGDLQPAARPD